MADQDGSLTGGLFGGSGGPAFGFAPTGSLTGGLFDNGDLTGGVTGDSQLSRFQRLVNKSGDQMTMNPSTPEDLGKDPEYLNILGTVMSRSQLEAMDGGKQILDLEARRRTGQRGFWEAAVKRGEGTFMGFEAADIPFAGDVLGIAIPIKEMRKVKTTLEKLDRGDYVDPQDKVYARLYLADAERKSQQGKMGKLGDVVHALPTLGAEMWLTSQAFAAAAAPLAAGEAATGVGAPAAVATETAAALSGALVGLVRGGLKLEARQAASKAAGAWLKAGLKKSYMDFVPGAVGESATKLGWGGAALRGMSELTLTALPKGAGYAGMDLLANAAINTSMGEEALSSRNEIEKQIAGYMDNNDELVKNARWLALGDKFVEYYSEMAGEGLGELAGLPIKGLAKAGYKRLPWAEKFGKTLETVWGSPAELAARRAELQGLPTPELRAKGVTALGMWGLNKMVDLNINPSKVAKVLTDTGYHGWIGEMMEERYGGFLNGLYGSDDGQGGLESAMKGMWPDKDQLFAEAIGFMIPIATLHATARMQNMKALGGPGMWNSSNWARGAQAVNEVSGVGGPVVDIHGQREAAAPAAPVTPLDADVTGDRIFFHGGLGRGMSLADVDLDRHGTQQNKRGRTYGGFYSATPSSRKWAEDYAAKRDGSLHQIVLRPEARILRTTDVIDRLSAEERGEYATQYDAVVGLDVVGREQMVLLNKDAVRSFTEISSPVTAPAETPAEAPAETPAPAAQSKKDVFEHAVDFLTENAESERTIANNKSSVLQRLAKGALRIANVAVTGDFGRMQAGDSISRYLQDYGINTPFARMISQYEDNETKAERDRLIAEATKDGKTLSAEELRSEKYDFEQIRASKKIQKARREYTSRLLTAVAAANGRIVLQESKLADAAKRQNVTPAELEARLREAVASGEVSVMDHGDGNKSIIRKTLKGENAVDAHIKAIETALDEALGPTRAEHALHTETLDRLDERVSGFEHNDRLAKGDADELAKLAIHTGRPVSQTDKLLEFVQTASELAVSESNSAKFRVVHPQRGINGTVIARIGEDGKAHVHPASSAEEDVAAAYYIHRDAEFASQRDLPSMRAHLQSMGLAPAVVPTKIKYIRRTSFINEDIVRLVQALGYDSRVEFSDEGMREYAEQLTLMETGNTADRESAKKFVAARRKLAEDSYVNTYGGNIERLKKVKIGGKEFYRFEVGATNIPGTVYVVVPPDTGARTSTTSIVEDILEEKMKSYYTSGRYHNYHIEYLERLQALAVRLAAKHETAFPKVAKELKSIADLLTAVSISRSRINYDSLSKPITMLLGHFDASATSGEGVLQASGWAALRQAIMEDVGTEAEPGMRTLTAGFLSKILQDTLGLAGMKEFQNIPKAFFPRTAADGYETNTKSVFQGKKLTPLADLAALNNVRQTGEAALESLIQKHLGDALPMGTAANVGTDAAQTALDNDKREKEKAHREKTEAEEAKDKPGDPVAEAGYASEGDAKIAHMAEKFEGETFEDFLTRKFCMGDNGPYYAKSKPSARRKRK